MYDIKLKELYGNNHRYITLFPNEKIDYEQLRSYLIASLGNPIFLYLSDQPRNLGDLRDIVHEYFNQSDLKNYISGIKIIETNLNKRWDKKLGPDVEIYITKKSNF